jgi:hypothetical protein
LFNITFVKDKKIRKKIKNVNIKFVKNECFPGKLQYEDKKSSLTQRKEEIIWICFNHISIIKELRKLYEIYREKSR